MESTQSSFASSPKLRRCATAAVAVSETRKRASPVRHQFPGEESLSEASATKSVLLKLATVPMKNTVILAIKLRSTILIVFFFSYESSDDSVTLLAESHGSIPARGKNCISEGRKSARQYKF